MTREERNELVLKHMRLVHKIANRYAYRAKTHGLDYEDLVNEGTIGLIKAIDNFNPSFGCVLSTYAVPKINGAIQVLLRDYYRGPKFYRKIKHLKADIVRQGLEDEQYSTIAEELHATIQEVVSAMEMAHGPMSFDKDIPNPKGDRGDMLFYEIVTDGTDFTDDIMLDAFIESLAERDKFVFVNRLDEKTQGEIGQALGISQAHVHRLLKRIRTELNEYLGRNVG